MANLLVNVPGPTTRQLLAVAQAARALVRKTAWRLYSRIELRWAEFLDHTLFSYRLKSWYLGICKQLHNGSC
jgi:hypothetical protein